MPTSHPLSNDDYISNFDAVVDSSCLVMLRVS
jgi:hypothetical protein